jgi:hypothetical protein
VLGGYKRQKANNVKKIKLKQFFETVLLYYLYADMSGIANFQGPE